MSSKPRQRRKSVAALGKWINHYPHNAMKQLLLFIIIISLGGCGYVEPNITEPTTIYNDAKLHKSDVIVSAQPRARQYQPLTALFIPFYVKTPMKEYVEIGTEMGAIFYQAWREKQMFPVFEYASTVQYRGRDRAIALARSKGADLAVVGIIPHIYFGSTVDDSDITIQINIYETRRGMLLFSMAQAGRVEFRETKDLFLLQVKQRMPSSPIHQLVRSMALDMAVPVQSWLPAPGTPYRFADDTEGIVKAMTTPAEGSGAGTEADGFDAAKRNRATGNGGQDDGQESGSQLTDAATMERDLRSNGPAARGVNLNINFDVDKDVIRSQSYPLLDSLARALKSPELAGKKVIIGGHTDSDANDLYNLDLSKRRAQAVKNYLVTKHGINPDLLATVGYGESRPLAKNTSTENKQKNRRVEIRLAE